MNFVSKLLVILPLGMLIGTTYDSSWTGRQVDEFFCYSFFLIMSVFISDLGLFKGSRWLPYITVAACPIFVDMNFLYGAAWFLVFGFVISPFVWALYLSIGMFWLLW